MPQTDQHEGNPVVPNQRWRVALRVVALALWSLLLIAFWYGARQAGVGPVDYLLTGIEELAARPWAPAGVLALYLVRPLLLIPITVANVTAGFVLGLLPGLVLALTGTLASATIGYGIGRTLGSAGLAHDLPKRLPVLGTLRRRSFESVVAGGLMYLHADAVNLPAGLLRIRFPVFLAGITVGNSLTMTSAVLAGSSVEGSLAEATVAIDTTTLLLALALFTLSLTVAAWLRRRHTPVREQRAAPAESGSARR